MKRNKKKIVPFQFKPFSKKQKKVLTWFMEGSPVKNKDIIIADGSVRSGKTVCMALAFVIFTNMNFNGETMAFCGKTIGSLRRNLIGPLLRMIKSRGYTVIEHRADNYMTISLNGRSNDYYLFGGKDEGSQYLIQGRNASLCRNT